ncbi:MAG: T9SS type A sorting domain-containing protein [Calditrichaeota bacterium]|nr:T9SS type A sorting domain-containing protein [Calditrichota bacterium]
MKIVKEILVLLFVTAGVWACPRGEYEVEQDAEYRGCKAEPAVCAEGWVKYEGNPVFLKGAEGEWDAGGVTCFVVRHFPWGYMMYYSCGGNYGRGFGLATSEDGINWERHPDNPVMAPDSGVTVWGPEVLHDGERYLMWYVSRGMGLDGISHCTSEDGVHWEQSRRNPVIDHGGCNAVIWDGEQYRMFVQHSSGRRHGFELHISQDGEVWESRGFAFYSGAVNTWDEITAAPSVAFYGDSLHFFYTGADTIGNARGQIAIGHAVSGDWGVSFSVPRDRTQLRALTPTERWEGRGLYSSGVDYDGETVKVWYAATGPDGGFGFATLNANIIKPPSNDAAGNQPNLWSVSPNPTAGEVRLNYLGSLSAPVVLKLFDMNGRLVHTAEYAANQPIRVNAAAIGLPVGMFNVAIEARGQVVHKRLARVK